MRWVGTGVEIEKMLPTPNIDLSRIPESQKYLQEGSHRRLYMFSPDDYREAAGVDEATVHALRTVAGSWSRACERVLADTVLCPSALFECGVRTLTIPRLHAY